ncbi:MAG: carboxypeptidase-like regulatory domain-containing protein [Tenacibaculum sp.]
MKKGLLFFLFFCTIISYSQTIIKGKISSIENLPLEGASVYLNNTTIGTISNSNGEFILKAKQDNYTLVVSFLGYKVKQIPIRNTLKQPFLNIKLEEDSAILDEVVIKKTVYDDNWKFNLLRFKQAFLGRSKLALECKILNEKDIHFDYNKETNTLNAITKKPLKIKHLGLGYLITYDLVDFTLEDKQLFFSGYARYENLRKSIRKKWRNNRLTTYNGSQMHFLRSLIAKKLKQDGFVINQFKRVLNPERPSEEKIKLAKKLLRLYNGSINLFKEVENPTTTKDSIAYILRKARLPKYRDYLYKRNVPYKDMLTFKNNIPYLDFNNYLMVIYKNEPEEENYLKGMFGKRRKRNEVQTSNIVLLQGKSVLDKAGILEPGSFFNEGYWGFESFGDMLPLDYQPSKN